VPRERRTSKPAESKAPDAVPDPRLLRTQRICRERARRERDVTIGRIVGDIGRQARHDMDRAGAAAEAWTAAMPAELVAETWLEQAGGAQIVVGVPSSAVAFAVDRALRLGALADIRLRMKSPGLRVRTRVGRSPAQDPDPPQR
jgi:hypothetical protein